MKLIVWNVAGIFDIKQGMNAGNGTYLRVIFKTMDDNKTITLNLPEQNLFPEGSKMLPYLKEGNILDMQLQSNGKNVNYFSQWRVVEIKDKNKTLV